MSAEWGWIALSFLGLVIGGLSFETWINGRVSIEQEKTRQAEIAAKAGKVKP